MPFFLAIFTLLDKYLYGGGNLKRYLFVLFIPFIFIITAKASMYEVRWENTTVDVLIDDDINKYIDIPIAKLYIDGICSNAVPSYNRGYDYTSIDQISVEVVGSYYVMYEARFNEYGISNVQEITFNVYDSSYPEFNIPKDIYISCNDEYDFSQIKCTDLIDGELEFKYKGKLNYGIVGDYEFVFYAVDSSNNKTEYEVTFHVIDDIPPSITILDNVIDVGSSINLNELVLCEDNYDNNLSRPLIIHNIDFYTVGEYDVKIYIKDGYDNYRILNEIFYVRDRKKPKIILKDDKIRIYVNDEINLKDYILEVTDNYCSLNLDNVEINTNYANEIGLYEAIYTVIDDYGNIGKNKLIIEVIDNPKIMIEAYNRTINAFDNFDPYERVFAYENDLDISYRINYSGYVDTTIPGLYEITYNAYDSYGNYEYKTVYINVLGNNSKTNISFPIGYTPNVKDEDKDINSVVDENKGFKIYYLIIPLVLLFIVVFYFVIRLRRKKKWKK